MYIRLFDENVDRLISEMDNAIHRNEVIASNVANVDTPGYRAKDLPFRTELKQALDGIHLRTSDPRHIGEGTTTSNDISVRENPNPGRADGNNVSIDDEMLKLSKNNINYNVAVQLLIKKFQMLKRVIDESRR